jgi:serine phosphatase RsbU (regulator of sigma subunit)
MKVKAAALIVLLTLSSILIIAEGQDTLMINIELSQKRLTDSLKAADLFRAAESYSESGYTDSAFANIQRSLDLSSFNNFPLIEAGTYQLLGSIYDEQSNWEETLLNYLKASTVYSRSGNRTREAGIFRILAKKYFGFGIYKKSAWYSEQEFSLCPQDSIEQMEQSSEAAALSWYYLPNDTMAVRWFTAALHYFEKEADTAGILRCTDRLASLYIKLGEYNQANDEYQQMLSAYVFKNDFGNIAGIYNNLGFLKFRKKDYENALGDFLSAVEYSGKGGKNDYFLTDVYSNIAICYQNLGKQKEMLQNFMTALQCAKDSRRDDEAARLDHLLALIYFKKGDNYHAELYCTDCIESAKKSENFEVLQKCYQTYSDVMEKGNDFVNALAYYEKYLNLRDSLSFANKIAEQAETDRQTGFDITEQQIKSDISEQEIQGLALKNLRAESSRKENELKLLLKQRELDRSEKDRLAQSLALEQEKSLTRENEQKVRSLEQEKIIQQLELDKKTEQEKVLQNANQLLEAKRQQQELQIEKEKQIKKLAFGIGILMVIVALMILFGLISTRKQNLKLAESKRQIEKINTDLELKNREVLKQNEKIIQQKDIIEQKNQAITDSIQYASRIQTAVLPPVNFLTDWGIDNFIIYKPKDIVSGDFYWGMRKKDKIIVAAADCTGHGVPGAFMSMLGHAFLDEILNTTEVENAAMILNLLRDEVINTLRQKGMVGEARDGMDISLCIIDKKAGKLDFAGANNPLYLIRDNSLKKVQADRMPIGIHFTTFIPFTNTTIEIKKGDYLYLFSDGYADQFGGTKGKKFMYKPFNDLILRNHQKPMGLQKEILDNTFVKWKGAREQVDDVLVIGMHL